MSFKKYPIEVNKGLKEKANYIHAAHFQMGSDKGNYSIPESKIAYQQQEMKLETLDPKVLDAIKNSHVGYLFDQQHQGNAKNMGLSVYQERIDEKAKKWKPAEKDEYVDMHKTTFPLGFEKLSYKTEATEQ